MPDTFSPEGDANAHATGSLALDYYRQRGAAIVPLPDEAAYEVRPREGAAVKVVFAREVHAGDMPVLSSTSPAWRAIVDDLTAEVAVSYRYLTNGPIAYPLKSLAAALPEGWQVESAKLKHVENRQAVGFSHRVTFDAPAMGARREHLSHHLWDVVDGERLEALEARLYQLPCLMLRPDHFPPEAVVRDFQERSMQIVDEDSDVRGAAIERELADMLEEAEKRTNQYFEQQMGNVVQRQALLTQKLDVAIRKLGEARQPDAIARLREEGETLAAEIARLEAGREEAMAAIEAACHAKLATERDRHELTATTDLVAICHAAHDVLTYRTTLVSPDGQALAWDLVYHPLTEALTFPACPRCEHPMDLPTPAGEVGFACRGCVQVCGGCGASDAPGTAAGACGTCATAVCARCETTCHACGAASCRAHGVGCEQCEAPLCAGCAMTCRVCQEPCCAGHAHQQDDPEGPVCEAHRLVMPTMAMPAPVALPAPVVRTVATLDFATSALFGPVVPEALVVEVEPVFEPAVAVEPAAAVGPAEAVEPAPEPFPMVETVVSKISGKVLHPLQAETCPSCRDHFEVKEIVNCATCGVPTCPLCMAGEHGPCPACDALEPVEPNDPRLAFAVAAFPALGRGKRKWEAATVGPYVLCHWARLGTWGLVVYHQPPDGGDPVVLTEFACGRMETMHQVLTGWWGG